METHQIAIYLGALATGALTGWAIPSATSLAPAITPALALLLYVTFLQIPLTRLVPRPDRFLAAVLIGNFVLAPLAVAAIFPFLPENLAIRTGVLLVLLTPCIDYVIVFSGLAGGASEKLLATTPVLLLAQLILLPAYLFLFLGPDLADLVDPRPFLEAFLFLIVVPLTLAALTQRGKRQAAKAMVPLMAVTLFTVTASQMSALDVGVVQVVPFYAFFLAAMAVAGTALARVFRLDGPESTAVIFSGATRNSLVVLPLALALPSQLAVASVVVVAQTLVELVGMVIFVRVFGDRSPKPRGY
ncbi:arsenic resistance protein [Actinophytocola xinjiangensis]|uniref:Arsenic resistance protein n=1 Tax=Actinophytocola xinjiangensis TaxID=485602 RepID=A0A7Z0WM20_9PSEU|nr:arsenic resistance protein [Actinophytocola xinjiangensis]OLF10164.1 arsenic resistance protein [Actinophytocola xinjiangensis]